MRSDGVTHIYEWVDPTKPIFFDFGDFLLTRTEKDFKELYSFESSMQEQAVKNSGDPSLRASSMVFSNELI